MDSQTQNTQSIQKIFFLTRLCRAFFADHFGIKKLGTSLRNGDAIVKIKNIGK